MKLQLLIFSILVILTSCGRKTAETKPIRKDVTETVFASGILEANGTYNLTAQNEGYLSELRFNEGDLIKSGDILAVIDNKQNNFSSKSSDALYEIARTNTTENAPSILQSQNSMLLARQKMQLDSSLLEKYQLLLASNSVSTAEYDNIKIQYQTSKANYLNAVENYTLTKQQARQSLITNEAQKEISKIVTGNNEIIALSNGKIYKKFKQRGDYVKKGDVIATIGDAEFIYAKVNIDEGNIAKVKVGLEAIVKLNTDKVKTYKGVVSEINPSFDEATQSFICKIIINEPLLFTIVNTQLQSNIIVEKTKNALLIPSNYIDFAGDVQIKGNKEKTRVTTKFVSNEWVQVLTGIDENTVLVTNNIKENNVATSEVGAQMK
jgi:HlyD family secretion protein